MKPSRLAACVVIACVLGASALAERAQDALIKATNDGDWMVRAAAAMVRLSAIEQSKTARNDR